MKTGRIHFKHLLTALLLVLCMGVLAGCANQPTQTSGEESGWMVVLNPNDRDQTVETVFVADGAAMQEPTAPTRADYVFTGWYTSRRCAGEPYDFSAPVTDDLFLYAGWTTTKIRLTVNFGVDGLAAEVMTMDGDALLTESDLPDVPQRENFRFTGWYMDKRCTQAVDFSRRMTKDMAIYAGWQQLTAQVTFDLGYFGAQNPPAQILDLTQGETTLDEPENPTRGEEGDYRFDGWYTGSGRNETCYDFAQPVTGDVALHAVWTKLRATVTYDMNCADMQNAAEKVAVGEKAAEALDTTREGYDFAGWYYDRDCTAQADLSGVTISDDLTVYAAWTAQERTITYIYNYDGAPENQTVTAHYDDTTVEPTEPARDGAEFIGWFHDAAQTTPYTFGSPLKENLTLYAGWNMQSASTAEDNQAASQSKTNLITYYINDGTDAVWKTEEVRRNKYSAMRTDGVTYPERAGYKAFGWYTTPDCADGAEFSANSRITAPVNLYVKWVKEYVFEAEQTQLTNIPIGNTGKTEDKLGFGESSNPKGLYLIEWDCYDAGASGDYYVSYLYNPGTYLEFCITASQDVENATLVLRLTPELHDMYFGTGGADGTAAEKNGYKVYVNPVYSFNSVTQKEVLESYEQVFALQEDLTGAVTKDEDPNYTSKRAFEDYTITSSMNLHQGDNIIRLVTDNNHDYGGSMHAAAPMVDCIKIYTNVDISWTEGKQYLSNLDGIDVRWPAKNGN